MGNIGARRNAINFVVGMASFSLRMSKKRTDCTFMRLKCADRPGEKNIDNYLLVFCTVSFLAGLIHFLHGKERVPRCKKLRESSRNMRHLATHPMKNSGGKWFLAGQNNCKKYYFDVIFCR